MEEDQTDRRTERERIEHDLELIQARFREGIDALGRRLSDPRRAPLPPEEVADVWAELGRLFVAVAVLVRQYVEAGGTPPELIN